MPDSADTRARAQTVLLLAANPSEHARSGFEDEFRAIEHGIARAPDRDRFQIVKGPALRPADLLELLNRHQPHIVHFCGIGHHGRGILLVDEHGQSHPIRTDALADAFRLCARNLRVVVLSACYAAEQAAAIARHVPWVVAVRGTRDHQAARTFTAQLYSALAHDREVENAFAQAEVLQRMRDEEQSFALFKDGKQILGRRPDPPESRPTRRDSRRDDENRARVVVALDRQGDRLHTTYYRDDGTTLHVADPRPWADIQPLIRAAWDDLGDRPALSQAEKRACGNRLFDIAFGPEAQWQPVIRPLLRHLSSEANPSRGPIDCRICTREPRLRDLPWRLTAWREWPLAEQRWTFATTSAIVPNARIHVYAPSAVLVISPDPEHRKAAREMLVELWPDRETAGLVREHEFGQSLPPDLDPLSLVYLHVPDGDPMQIERAVAEFRQLEPRPRAVYLGTPYPVASALALHAGIPLVLYRTQPWHPDADALGLAWLHAWLSTAGDPLAALHTLTIPSDEPHRERFRHLAASLEGAALAAHVGYDFDGFTTDRSRQARPEPTPRLKVDRETAKLRTQDRVLALHRPGEQRVLTIIAYAAPDHAVASLREQLEHKLKPEVRGIRWVGVQLPEREGRLSQDLPLALCTQLGQKAGETPRAMLQRWRVRGVRGGDPVLWLDYGTHGAAEGLRPPITPDTLDAWVEFCSATLTNWCPDNLRIVAYIAVETRHHDQLRVDLGELVRDYRNSRFGLLDLSLELVDVSHLSDYMNSPECSCPDTMQSELIELILADSRGVFDPVIALLEEGQSGGWRRLRTRLREVHPTGGRPQRPREKRYD